MFYGQYHDLLQSNNSPLSQCLYDLVLYRQGSTVTPKNEQKLLLCTKLNVILVINPSTNFLKQTMWVNETHLTNYLIFT